MHEKPYAGMHAHLHACSCIDEEGACMKNHMQACMKSEACMHYSHHCMHKNVLIKSK